MSDQETQHIPSEEHSQKTKQPERGGGGRDRDRSRRRHGQSQPRRPEASLNMDELRELVELIAEYGFTDFELEREGFRVRLGRSNQPSETSTPAPPDPRAAPAGAQQSGTVSAPAPPSGSITQSVPSQPGVQPGGETAPPAAVTEDEDLHIIPSPIVGTFYRTPSPTAEPFVRLGSQVNPDTVVCIIEAMKLMNEIQAETSGEVVKIYVENGQPVEYGQPLFGIKK